MGGVGEFSQLDLPQGVLCGCTPGQVQGGAGFEGLQCRPTMASGIRGPLELAGLQRHLSYKDEPGFYALHGLGAGSRQDAGQGPAILKKG